MLSLPQPGCEVVKVRNYPLEKPFEVLVAFDRGVEGSSAILKGIASFHHGPAPWRIVPIDLGKVATIDTGWISAKSVDGVINCLDSQSLAQTCGEHRIPFVNLGDLPAGSTGSHVRPDHTMIGHLGADHFLKQQFKRFCFCGFQTSRASVLRRDGFVEALRLAGHRCEIFESSLFGPITPALDLQQVASLGCWLNGLPDETAIFACSDFRARQVVRAAQIAGRSVPESLAVLGVGDDPTYCEMGEVTLSSVGIKAELAGFRAAAELDRLMRNEAKETRVQSIEPAGVVVRSSTDMLALREKNVAKALRFIHEHACRGITVSQVLGEIHTPRSWLERKFRQLVGRSPQAEIRRAQVIRVKQLLKETDLPLKSIAAQTGFAHVEYMIIVYKRVTGETPGRYRRTGREQDQSPRRVAV